MHMTETVSLCRNDGKAGNPVFRLMILVVLGAQMEMTHEAWPIKLSFLGINSERLRGLSPMDCLH